jgi:hypothetical protein
MKFNYKEFLKEKPNYSNFSPMELQALLDDISKDDVIIEMITACDQEVPPIKKVLHLESKYPVILATRNGRALLGSMVAYVASLFGYTRIYRSSRVVGGRFFISGSRYEYTGGGMYKIVKRIEPV